MHFRRSLPAIATKKFEASIQSLSSITHSYAIMPIVSASGQLFSPLYIVSFGLRCNLKKSMKHFKNWFEEIFLRNTESPGSLKQLLPKHKQIAVLNIPKKITDLSQAFGCII
ncbi:hypothetical protein WH47_01691 [Habropoda laboriosa]|uniref:Uncharacterized protein n=1 Tax=Habropoda laboriosa TaxID=597456 RepID=A0A0L7QZV4_9HYME|nr:hypothetical protein WH47_01691 [Habropoda laboriosa]